MSGVGLTPVVRSELWRPLTEAAEAGRLVLQVCAQCGHVQYPPREICSACLGSELGWESVSGTGQVLSWTRLHASSEPYFRDGAPWHIGSVQLASGPVLITFLHADCLQQATPVEVLVRTDAAGQAVFVAVPPGVDRAGQSLMSIVRE